MITQNYRLILQACFCLFSGSFLSISAQNSPFQLNDREYFSTPGLDLMVFQDFYPDGHQGGVSIVQNGIRVIANGDLRLEPAPGQWAPVPKKGKTVVDREKQEIRVPLWYPDSSKNRKGFNPIEYPDLNFRYEVKVRPEGDAFRVTVDLEEALPDQWYGKVGFNLELFPGFYFGKGFIMDDQVGIFPRQYADPIQKSAGGTLQLQPLARGKRLSVAPEDASQTIRFSAEDQTLELIDGRGEHNNGWFIVRTLLQKGKLKNAVSLLIQPSYAPDWQYAPVIQVSQVGYHPQQTKKAVLEVDPRTTDFPMAALLKVDPQGGTITVKRATPSQWGPFLRYQYLQFDFTEVSEPGLYQISYQNQLSHPFQIHEAVYDQHVWQPTLEYYLPVQMCHVRVNDRYKVWHGLCHNDDALMAPTDLNHFDGYVQGPSTLTTYQSGDPVPGLNVGGWHDAGDYDLRVESQAKTVMRLAQMHQLFGVDYDITTVEQDKKLVEMHRPDGRSDILQQLEHGALTIVAGYESLGRLYRGIICPTLRQYTLLGDGMTMTDNLQYDAALLEGEKGIGTSAVMDDRWVFTEDNPRREIPVAASLAAAYRSLAGYNDTLAEDCLEISRFFWNQYQASDRLDRVDLAVELFLSTGETAYEDYLVAHQAEIVKSIGRTGPSLAKAAGRLSNKKFVADLTAALRNHRKAIDKAVAETPFGVQYTPNIWGAGWGIQSFGVDQYFLYRGFPEVFSPEPFLHALNFVLGVHPGSNNASFVSGVGANSLTVAYGVNRDDWSYIPGGSASGTALIRPDLPELKVWPYFWQQTEYVMGGGATNFMFLALAAQDYFQQN